LPHPFDYEVVDTYLLEVVWESKYNKVY
jgi:hypothetical protein